MPDEPSPEPTIADLAAATPEEIAEALSYALRFDERGKPRRGGWDFAAGLAAERLADHLRRSGFIIMRPRPTRPHSAG
jgi:protein ImuA